MVDFAPIFRDIEAQYGLTPNFLSQVVAIENPQQNPNITNRFGYKGLFQEGDPFIASHGNLNPFDPQQSAEMAARGFSEDRQILHHALGRAPTDGELYLAHQQGPTGASELLTHPNAPAERFVGLPAVVNNGGFPGETAANFADRWVSRFNPPAPAIGGPNPPAATSPPLNLASAAQRPIGQRPYLPSTMNSPQPNTYTPPPAQNNFDNAVQAYLSPTSASTPTASAQPQAPSSGNAIASLLGGLTSAFKAPEVSKPDPATLLSEQQALNGDFGTQGQGTQPGNGSAIAQAILARLPAPLVLNS